MISEAIMETTTTIIRTPSIKFNNSGYTVVDVQWKINPPSTSDVRSGKIYEVSKGTKQIWDGVCFILRLIYRCRRGLINDCYGTYCSISFCSTSALKCSMLWRLKSERVCESQMIDAKVLDSVIEDDEWYSIVVDFPHKLKEVTVECRFSRTDYTDLTKDLKKMLNNGLHSDITVMSADGVEFTAHKGILASRSDVFKALFEHNTIECTSNIVESPLEAGIFKDVLAFIYTGEAPNINETAEKLLAAADYYGLLELKYFCGEVLEKQLKVENAIRILQLADLHSAENLKLNVLHFIKTANTEDIIKTEDWSNLKDPELIKDILKSIVCDRKHP